MSLELGSIPSAECERERNFEGKTWEDRSQNIRAKVMPLIRDRMGLCGSDLILLWGAGGHAPETR